jgi:hypothetical protein
MTTHTSGDADTRSTAELREDIEQTRADLGDTAAALAAKTDVKARVKGSAARTTDRIKEKAEQAADAAGQLRERVAGHTDAVRGSDVAAAVRHPVPIAALATAVAAVIAAVVLIRRRRR